MRWSKAFIPTLRDDPAEAEAASHKLLIRAGFIRQLQSGVYSMLPLAFRTRAKIMEITRQEIDRIGGQEFLLPALHPGELWKASGRWQTWGAELFRFKDRRENDLCLGPTHEEVFATIATELSSYRQLPQIWYQIQTKFRDEPRPRSGVLRTREFTMKDSYSLDVDRAGLDRAFDAHEVAYRRIFERMGMQPVAVQASSGAMGGSESVEFMVHSASGEDLIATCASCGYAANVERAMSTIPAVDDGPPELEEPEEFPTPGVRTIKALADIEGGAAPDRQIKTLVYVADGELMLVLVRGDHDVVEQKVRDGLGVVDLRPAHPDEIREALGALPGSLGGVGVTGLRIAADPVLRGRRNMVTGANRDDFHLRGVDVERDITVASWLDVRAVEAGEACPTCGQPLQVDRAIEAGHIFKLGTRFSEQLGASVLDEGGSARPIVMGSYGIGMERCMAAVVEANHDERGIIWPMSVAPYEVVVTVLRPDDESAGSAGDRLYEELVAAGVEVILDDRNERPGVKFADAELVGFPVRITVGPKGLAQGRVEVTPRATLQTDDVAFDEAASRVAEMVRAARPGGP